MQLHVGSHVSGQRARGERGDAQRGESRLGIGRLEGGDEVFPAPVPMASPELGQGIRIQQAGLGQRVQIAAEDAQPRPGGGDGPTGDIPDKPLDEAGFIEEQALPRDHGGSQRPAKSRPIMRRYEFRHARVRPCNPVRRCSRTLLASASPTPCCAVGRGSARSTASPASASGPKGLGQVRTTEIAVRHPQRRQEISRHQPG